MENQRDSGHAAGRTSSNTAERDRLIGGEHSRTRISELAARPLVARQDVLVQLERIVTSKVFVGSNRLRRFLTWTVERSLKGETENIKQYAIGLEVFDRGADFDPRIDSIVRTEAQRLRRKLSEYYQTEGTADPILILFEPGSYIPDFRRRHTVYAAEKPATAKFVSIDVPRHRVAVLPFSNLNGNTGLDYLCYGIADGIQTQLARSPNLLVISTFSASRVTSAERDFTRIGRTLDVDTLIEGSIQLAGKRIRVHARVIDTGSNGQVWAQVFDQEIQGAFALEEEIAQAVARVLAERVGNEVPVSGPTPEAYKLYLRGRYFWNRLRIEDSEKAVPCFLRAISLCPEYSQAYAALAETYHWLVFFQARRPVSTTAITRRLSVRALGLDPHCAEAHVALGIISGVVQWEWDEAEVFFHRGLELRPNYLLGYMQRSFCRLQRGDLEGSRADVDKALDLDPLSSRSHRIAGLRLYLQRDYYGALNAFEGALELGPEIENTWYYLGLVLLQAGRSPEAIAAIRKSLHKTMPTAHLGALVAAYTADGQPHKAQEVLRQLHELSTHAFVPPLAFVHAYAGIGQKSESLNWLERAADERYTGLMQIKLDPILDSLKDEPRFHAVLERMHIA